MIHETKEMMMTINQMSSDTMCVFKEMKERMHKTSTEVNSLSYKLT